MTDQRHYSGPESRSAAGDRSPWLIAIVISIATFMVVLDTAIANVSLRYIAGSLAVSVDESTWVVTTYLIANAVILPISGWLSNVIGRKRFYMICVAVFTLASLLCGLASSLTALIVCRILQGLGGGGMPTSEQAMLADTFSVRQRPQAFAIYGIAVIVAPTVGPTIGGWITDNYSWHWIFFINVPFGLLSLVLVQWLVVEPEVLEREREERLAGGLKIDWVGFALVALMFGSLEFVLDRGQIEDWFHSTTIVMFATISACSLIFFIPWELTRDDPIVDIRLLGRRQFGMAFVVMLAVGALLFGSNQITPQLMQTNFPYTAMLSGLAMMPGGLAMLIMMPIIGQVAGRVQPKYLIATGFTIIAVAMWYSTSLVPDASFSYFAMIRVFQTVGMPFMFIPINRLYRPAAAKNRRGFAAHQRGPQSRRQHRRIARQHRIGAAGAISPSTAGGEFDAILAELSIDAAQFDAILQPIWIAGERPTAGVRVHRPDCQRSGRVARLYRYLLQLGGIRRRTRADRSPADTARWAGHRPSRGWPLIFCRSAVALLLGKVFGKPMKIATMANISPSKALASQRR